MKEMGDNENPGLWNVSGGRIMSSQKGTGCMLTFSLRIKSVRCFRDVCLDGEEKKRRGAPQPKVLPNARLGCVWIFDLGNASPGESAGTFDLRHAISFLRARDIPLGG